MNAQVQYGLGVKALVTLLHQSGYMSMLKIQTLSGDLLPRTVVPYPISPLIPFVSILYNSAYSGREAR